MNKRIAVVAGLALIVLVVVVVVACSYADTRQGQVAGEVLEAVTPAAPARDASPTGYVTHESVVAIGFVPTDEPASSFLTEHGMKVYGERQRFIVQIPKIWEFHHGQYPEGLYWAMVQELNQGLGFDLRRLKGETVEIWRWYLAKGVKGPGTDTHYPTAINLLIHEQAVKGAWLAFNMTGIGPSIQGKTFEQIVGGEIEEWAITRGFFALDQSNEDLKDLDPVSVVRAFCDAIRKGDRLRAQSCMSPKSAINSLTMNLGPNMLYHQGFSGLNSMINNITKAELLSYTMYVYEDDRIVHVSDVGSHTSINLSAEMRLTWRDAAFNSSDGMAHRFIALRKTPLGWKIDGMGTGP